MCGITGILRFQDQPAGDESRSLLLDRLKKMADTLDHRGPDGEGYWLNPAGSLGFGHRRLSIIDLSSLAAQPMHWKDRYTIVYNGEIYNYPEVREELINRGYTFQSQSDTEVLLASYDYYQEACLNYLDGMFAFAIWDEQEKCLFAARDRFGEKPFYYSHNTDEFRFASERKALWAGGIEKKINFPLLLNFLTIGYTQTVVDRTITYFQDVYALPPAHFLKINSRNADFQLQCYWDIDKQRQINISEQDATDQFRELFSLSVKRRLRSDVRLGASLSGGLDSSSIVGTIQRLQGRDKELRTFSAVFPGFENDESLFIDQMTNTAALKSERVSPGVDDFIGDFAKLCYFQEEPFSSASIYAQYKVFELAHKEGVKVLLDGQGADETLAGYGKYIHWYLQEMIGAGIRPFNQELHALRKNQLPFQWGWKNYFAAWFPTRVPSLLEKRELRRMRQHPDINPSFRAAHFDAQTVYKPFVSKLNDILYFNTCQSGLEELLRYADRNSMANGCEMRLPFLSHELVQFVFSLPAKFKIHEGWTKWILRESMKSELPKEIVWRRGKVGFEPPQKSWMGDKRMIEYVHEAKRKLVNENILKPSVLSKKNQPQDAHAADNDDWRYLIAAATLNHPG